MVIVNILDDTDTPTSTDTRIYGISMHFKKYRIYPNKRPRERNILHV